MEIIVYTLLWVRMEGSKRKRGRASLCSAQQIASKFGSLL